MNLDPGGPLTYGSYECRSGTLGITTPFLNPKFFFNSMSTQKPTGKGGANARSQLQARERVEQAQSQSRSHPQLQSRIVKAK